MIARVTANWCDDKYLISRYDPLAWLGQDN